MGSNLSDSDQYCGSGELAMYTYVMYPTRKQRTNIITSDDFKERRDDLQQRTALEPIRTYLICTVNLLHTTSCKDKTLTAEAARQNE